MAKSLLGTELLTHAWKKKFEQDVKKLEKDIKEMKDDGVTTRDGSVRGMLLMGLEVDLLSKKAVLYDFRDDHSQK